jgi:diaminopropionate ammonia-lyase
MMHAMTTQALWCRSGPPARSQPRPVPDELLAFHRMLPGYAPTPLVELPEVATRMRVGRVRVKDESDRLGLPAFKAASGSSCAATACQCSRRSSA